MEFAEIEDEVVIAGQYGKIEIWSQKNYEQISKADDEFASNGRKNTWWVL